VELVFSCPDHNRPPATIHPNITVTPVAPSSEVF
jgi:hypothetical protein